ncbi:hypothetical protein [Clostridium sp. DJ247]|uniref:hypothetical protein n=1 Tax=Clostridium sp. DJ247 TaxID=2726188 RepID=UPI001625E808|nr:hypothetical protein [Clostridium sp. DJ247]MBC2579960.1 hypothetical protein [Clostridium sp. DJ247]
MENIRNITSEMTMEEAGQIMLAERNEFLDRMDKALQSFIGKSIMVEINGVIFTSNYYENFGYNYFTNSRNEPMLTFKNAADDEFEITVSVDDITIAIVADNIDDYTEELAEGENEYYADDVEIYLCDSALSELTIRLELQWA